ncbi:hypothetical protein DM02DRAFT_536228, partial [Periconia macrospinosa]
MHFVGNGSDSILLANNRSARFLGLARLKLNKLNFEQSVKTGHREVSEKTINKLINVFKFEGCRRYDEENYVDALIDQNILLQILSTAGLDLQYFRHQSRASPAQEIQELNIGGNVDCLNGLHRIKAAQRFLDPNDQWWIVRLYSKEFETDARACLVQSFQHEQKYSDGMIFRNIRKAQREGKVDDENVWWARLTDGKRRDLRQLIKNKALILAFDSLLEFPGLWEPIQLGTLHRLHGLRCEEELINYLQHIRNTWCFIVVEGYRDHVDTATVCGLELRAPGKSRYDMEQIRDNAKIFSSLDGNRRSLLLERAVQVNCIIPSLRTFFENQKYLEPCSLILKGLLSPNEKRSLWKSFSANYFPPQHLEVQVSETEHTAISPQSLGLPRDKCVLYQRRIAYIQLWLFCFRNFPEM